MTKEFSKLTDTFRQKQELNDRIVETNEEKEEDDHEEEKEEDKDLKEGQDSQEDE